MGYIGTKPSAVPLTSADITDGIITSAKIADGSIVNADINASSAIAISKIASTGTSLQVLRMNTGATALEFATLSTGAAQEVGTWTPTWSLEGGTITSTDTTSYSYVKVGRIVVAQVQAHLNTSSGSGSIYFTLPFTTSGNGSFVGTEYGQAGLILFGQYADNSTDARMNYTGSFTQNGYFRVTVIYRSAS